MSAPHVPAAPPAPRAALGFGRVWHRRLRPAAHEFDYANYFVLLPMRALRRQPDACLPRNRFGLMAFHDRDHGDGGPDALAWVEALLTREGVRKVDGEIWLQTYPRVLGHAFKPVSFWYAHRADGSLAAIVAEVNNTFGERHAYLLASRHLGWDVEQVAAKVFHVSPFCQAAGHYRFRFSRTLAANGSWQGLVARVDHDDAQGPLLQTSLGGRLEPLSPAGMRRALLGIPLMTLGVVARIHWQALRLWLKRVPFFSKPQAPDRFVTR